MRWDYRHGGITGKLVRPAASWTRQIRVFLKLVSEDKLPCAETLSLSALLGNIPVPRAVSQGTRDAETSPTRKHMHAYIVGDTEAHSVWL